MLTREQLFDLLDKLRFCSSIIYPVKRDAFLDDYDQLRAEVERLKHELHERMKDCMEHCQDQTRSQMGWNQCKRDLATAHAEMRRLREALEKIQDIAGDQDYTEVKFEVYQVANLALQEAQRGGEGHD